MEPMELGADDRGTEEQPMEPMELHSDYRQMEPMELRAHRTARVIQKQPGNRQNQFEQISRRFQLHVQSKLMRASHVYYNKLRPKRNYVHYIVLLSICFYI